MSESSSFRRRSLLGESLPTVSADNSALEKCQMSKKKREGVLVIFTLHQLTLGKPDEALMSIEWKCSGHSGTTERVFATDGILSFEKLFRFRSKLRKTKSGYYEPKYLKFKVCRFYSDKPTKIFGRAEVDLRGYLLDAPPLTSDVVLDSPHKDDSSLAFTLCVKRIKNLDTNIDPVSTLTSESEAFQLTQDKTSSWDVSESLSPEDLKLFQETRINREKAIQYNLDEFAKAEAKPRRKRRKSFKVMPGVLDKRAEENARDLADFFTSSKTDRESDRAKSVGMYLSQQEAMNMFKVITHFKWSGSPLQQDPVCLPASVFYAAFLRCSCFDVKLLSNFYFPRVIDTFFRCYEQKEFMLNCSHYDIVLNSIHLCALLKLPPPTDFDERRIRETNERLYRIIVEQFSQLVEILCEDIGTFIQQLFVPNFDQSNCLYDFSHIFLNISHVDVPGDVWSLVIDRCSEVIDARFVEALLDRPKLCTFTNGSLLNSFVTLVEAEHPKCRLTKFREANSALMMAQTLRKNPSECDSICPNLPKSVVLKLLMNQEPDELMPILDDNVVFEQYFRSKIQNDTQTLISPVKEWNFKAIIDKLDVTGWRTVSIPTAAFAEMSFLSDFFQHKTDVPIM